MLQKYKKKVEGGMWKVGVAEADVGTVVDLGAEVVAAFGGGIEAQGDGVSRKVVDEGPAIRA